jgi:cathepsin B
MISATAALLGSSTASLSVEYIQPDAPLHLPAKPLTVFDHIAEKVNSMQTTWTAEAPHDRFGNLEDVKTLCGSWVKGHPKYIDWSAKLPDVTELDASLKDVKVQDLPASFDARTAHSQCTVISKIRDQSACGSCWAHGSTEAFEDSRCIATGEDVEFSTADTNSCCSGFACGMSNGCNGGQPSAALNWMSRTGVVTGGDYPDKDKGQSCKSYTLAPCAHHVPPTSKYPACPKEEYHTPMCKRSCESEYSAKTYKEDKTKSSKAFSVNGVNQIMAQLVKGGTLSCAFTVYSDFPTYKSGVYKRTAGSQPLGGHAVAIIGYGTEDGTDYWLVKNSWNEQWGDGGTFKILRGENECGIEDDVAGVSF